MQSIFTKITVVQVDYVPGDGYYVRYVYEDDAIDQDICFERRSAAEARADHLAKRHGCAWETNYA